MNRPTPPHGPWAVGIDTGGTFTDFVAVGAGEWIAFKVPSTPDDPAAAVDQAFQEFLRRRPELAGHRWRLVHGSTVATNALLEGRTAHTLLVTNEGFEDLIEIGRQARQDLYDLQPRRPAPLIARQDRLGVAERTGPDGRRECVPTPEQLEHLRRTVQRRNPEAVAIGLLHAYANPAAERQVARALRSLRLPMSCSSEVAPLFREYERFSTTAANAALLPRLAGYLKRLATRFRDQDLLIQQSNGGLTSVRDASRHPVRLVLSGPAGGVKGAERWLEAADRCAVTFDMGGTSTDVCLIREGAGRTEQVELAGRPLLVDSLDVHSIGAGGGSLLWVDEADALRVGPGSAGADPGPACYGRGMDPCLTDAHVVLGRLPLEERLGGAIQLDPERSHAALKPLARRFRVPLPELCEHALAIADAHMEKAIKTISLERGHDPREAILFSFGGAGGLHACRLATRLGMPEVRVPPAPGACCAFGMAVSDARLDESQGLVRRLDDRTLPVVQKALGRLADRGRARLRRELGPGPVRIERRIALRYQGQSHELLIPWSRSLRKRFEEAHQRRYGFLLPERALECVALTVTAVRASSWQPPPSRSAPRRPAPILRRTAFHLRGRRRPQQVPVVDRAALRPGMVQVGPAVVLEETSTLVVEIGFTLRVDGQGCLRLINDAVSAS